MEKSTFKAHIDFRGSVPLNSKPTHGKDLVKIEEIVSCSESAVGMVWTGLELQADKGLTAN